MTGSQDRATQRIRVQICSRSIDEVQMRMFGWCDISLPRTRVPHIWPDFGQMWEFSGCRHESADRTRQYPVREQLTPPAFVVRKCARSCFLFMRITYRLALRSMMGSCAPRLRKPAREGSEPSGGGPMAGLGPVSAGRAADAPGKGGAVLRNSICSPLIVPVYVAVPTRKETFFP